jgi:hypothetical protein
MYLDDPTTDTLTGYSEIRLKKTCRAQLESKLFVIAARLDTEDERPDDFLCAQELVQELNNMRAGPRQ